jgi:hypothetical protein
LIASLSPQTTAHPGEEEARNAREYGVLVRQDLKGHRHEENQAERAENYRQDFRFVFHKASPPFDLLKHSHRLYGLRPTLNSPFF